MKLVRSPLPQARVAGVVEDLIVTGAVSAAVTGEMIVEIAAIGVAAGNRAVDSQTKIIATAHASHANRAGNAQVALSLAPNPSRNQFKEIRWQLQNLRFKNVKKR
jgi:hypothetical protein